MLYFIIETPYEKCFELFFKDELGYPNFYRMSELITQNEPHPELILITPPPSSNSSDFSDKIIQKVDQLGIRYHSFGEGIQTQFIFHHDGKVRTEAHFQQALSDAIQNFYRN